MPTHETFTPDVINQIIPIKRQEIHSAKSHVGLQLIASTAGSRTLAVQYNLGWENGSHEPVGVQVGEIDAGSSLTPPISVR